MLVLFLALGAIGVGAYAPLREPGAGLYKDAGFLQDVLDRMNRNLDLGGGSFIDLGNRMDDLNIPEAGFGRQAKDAEFMDALDYDLLLNGNGNAPSIRDTEYMQHSSLQHNWGHKYMTGGGSEGKPEKEIKTDAVLPAYCNPPNPCPVGYSAEDGCIETFENTAAFSRAYQASQDCMCDTEHMFDCPAPKEQNNELDLTQTTDFLLKNLGSAHDGQHKSLVAKKFYNPEKKSDQLDLLTQLAQEAAAEHVNSFKAEGNPYLEGEKLPIAAKKGQYVAAA